MRAAEQLGVAMDVYATILREQGPTHVLVYANPRQGDLILDAATKHPWDVVFFHNLGALGVPYWLADYAARTRDSDKGYEPARNMPVWKMLWEGFYIRETGIAYSFSMWKGWRVHAPLGS